MNVRTKFEIRSFTPSWDNSGYFKNSAVPEYTHAPFSPKFLWACVRVYPVNVPAKFEVRSFTSSWDNSDWICGWGLRTPNLGEEAAGGRGWYRSKERLWVPIGPPE